MRERGPTNSMRTGTQVAGTFIDALDWDTAINTIMEWGVDGRPETVCLCNVHSAVTAAEHPLLANALKTASMVLPDGQPIAWMLRKKGFSRQNRLAGPDLMLKLCNVLQQTSTGVFLFGSSIKTLGSLQHNLKKQYPNLIISGSLSPRYGNWTPEEEAHFLEAIKKSGAGIVFVGLGCPKQEVWMAEHSKEISGVLIGVGAAFDFHSGTMSRAPPLIQKMGLEWLYRFMMEPRRLGKRYLVTNTRFIVMALGDLLTTNKSSGDSH